MKERKISKLWDLDGLPGRFYTEFNVEHDAGIHFAQKRRECLNFDVFVIKNPHFQGPKRNILCMVPNGLKRHSRDFFTHGEVS